LLRSICPNPRTTSSSQTCGVTSPMSVSQRASMQSRHVLYHYLRGAPRRATGRVSAYIRIPLRRLNLRHNACQQYPSECIQQWHVGGGKDWGGGPRAEFAAAHRLGRGFCIWEVRLGEAGERGDSLSLGRSGAGVSGVQKLASHVVDRERLQDSLRRQLCHLLTLRKIQVGIWITVQNRRQRITPCSLSSFRTTLCAVLLVTCL
jgi:hypothetical protein